MYSCLSSSSARISLIFHKLSNFRRYSHMGFSSFSRGKNLHTSRSQNETLQKQNTQTSGMPLSLSLSLSLYSLSSRMRDCATCVFILYMFSH
jgi:hypothetical protein